MDIKKFNDFIKENKSVTETDIREYIKEELNIAKNNIFIKIGTQFSLDDNQLSDDNQLKLDNLFNQLIDLYRDITIENISNFEKTWESPENKINEGDTVVDKKTGEEYFVTRFGSNNNFYDADKRKYIPLDDVKKKE